MKDQKRILDQLNKESKFRKIITNTDPLLLLYYFSVVVAGSLIFFIGFLFSTIMLVLF